MNEVKKEQENKIVIKFQELLNKLFQFESSDLDFGIYRILNYKRKEVEEFINNKIPKIVDESFKKHKDKLLGNINQEFEKVKEEIKKVLGEDAFTPTGDLKDEFKNTPLGQNYYEIKNQKGESDKIEEIKIQVFNDLYSFFSRYYEDGDFIPQYRYSLKKKSKYSIPYNGEEVKLYWVNSDQYYIKTGILFRDYTFKKEDIKIIFRTVEAKEEIGPNKATKERLFILDNEKPIEINNDEVIIKFQYRELIEEEVKNYEIEGRSNTSKQEKINERSFDVIKDVLEKEKNFKLIKYLIDETKNDRPFLLYHINRFTAKNTRDYFIHKNLEGFLKEQLEYFIKSEVLDYEALSNEKYFDKHITRAKVVHEIGEKIILFLSHIENFQKRLWEKKKFVIKTGYVITLDRINEWCGEELLEEVEEKILKNKEQIKEWEELGFGKIQTKEDLFIKDGSYKKLPIDTKHFDDEFKFILLEKISEKYDLDDLLDGLLIKSENWQVLNTIFNKYKEKVQTIYIDPPFNKEQDADYLYNVKYKDSTWVSMLENRLRLARNLLNDKGSIFVRCDYNGNWIVRPLMNEIFGSENFRNEIILRKGNVQAVLPSKFNPATDFLFFYFKNMEKGVFNPLVKEKERELNWIKMISSKDNPIKNWCFVNGVKFIAPKGYHWNQKQENIDKFFEEGKIIAITDREEIISKVSEVKIKEILPKFQKGMIYKLENLEYAVDSNWTDIPGYSNITSNIIEYFPTENSEILLKRVIESTSNDGDIVMDFFLGSGTTTAVAHKLGRKWLGVEMGEHFYSVVLPRMKKVLAYDKSGVSKEKDVKEKYNENNAGGFFKYQVLEQYEDTLDNIELKENLDAKLKFGDDYLIKYFLDFETRESDYLLNIENLKKPFSYRLKVNLSEVGEPQEIVVDIPETFNYLLGIKIKKIKKKEKDGKIYLFTLGEKEGKDIVIIFREYDNSWDEDKHKKDKEFIKNELKDWKPQIVYVNGQSILTPNFEDFQVEIKYVEPEFKRLMEMRV